MKRNQFSISVPSQDITLALYILFDIPSLVKLLMLYV